MRQGRIIIESRITPRNGVRPPRRDEKFFLFAADETDDMKLVNFYRSLNFKPAEANGDLSVLMVLGGDISNATSAAISRCGVTAIGTAL